MEQAKAFAPGNISCVFKIVPDEDPSKMHSLGMGFTVSEGVEVTVSEDKRTTVTFNGAEIAFPTVMAVAQKLACRPVSVEIVSDLVLSSGFGLSGASALATAHALNALLGLGKSEEELAMTAHVAEVENLTGLGDVCAQWRGGCLVKLRPGHPLSAEPLGVAEQPIYYRYFGPIHTKEILRDDRRRERINKAADKALEDIKGLMETATADLDAYIRVSKAFALDSGLLTDRRVLAAIQQIETDGGTASMIMLGNAVFSTRPFEGASQTNLSRQSARVL